MLSWCCLLSLCYSSHPTAHFATLSSFTSTHSVLLLRTSLCPPFCLLASFLPLHLYYLLNNSLYIELCACSFCSQSPEGVSLEAPVAGRTCFFLASAPSLFVFCHSSAFRRFCYSLFCDTVWDYSHPKFELLPNNMPRT